MSLIVTRPIEQVVMAVPGVRRVRSKSIRGASEISAQFDPAMMNLAFNTFILPCLGFLFLPFTTLMYVILWTPGVGLTGWDWLWLGIAVLLDLGHYTYSAYGNRNQIPGMSSSQ